MVRRLSESTGTGVSIWIKMQVKLDTWEAENMPPSRLHPSYTGLQGRI